MTTFTLPAIACPPPVIELMTLKQISFDFELVQNENLNHYPHTGVHVSMRWQTCLYHVEV